jgi:hypothetical protein
MRATFLAFSLIAITLISARNARGQQVNQLPDGYLCFLSRVNDCLEKVPALPAEWNVRDVLLEF